MSTDIQSDPLAHFWVYHRTIKGLPLTLAALLELLNGPHRQTVI